MGVHGKRGSKGECIFTRDGEQQREGCPRQRPGRRWKAEGGAGRRRVATQGSKAEAA